MGPYQRLGRGTPIPVPTEKDRKHWLGMGRIRLWEAVALSFDVEPRGLCSPDLCHQIEFVSVAKPNIDQYRIRLELAESHVDDGIKGAEVIVTEGGCRCQSRVRLDEFGAWAADAGADIDLPSWFPVAVRSKREAIDPRQRKTYLKIIAVLAAEAKVGLDQPYGSAPAIVSAAKTLGLSLEDKTVAKVLAEAADVVKAKGT